MPGIKNFDIKFKNRLISSKVLGLRLRFQVSGVRNSGFRIQEPLTLEPLNPTLAEPSCPSYSPKIYIVYFHK